MVSPVDEKISPKTREDILSNIETALNCMNTILKTRGVEEFLSGLDIENVIIIRNTLEKILRERGN